MITKTMIEMALSHVDDPDLGRNLIELGMIENIAIDGKKVSFDRQESLFRPCAHHSRLPHEETHERRLHQRHT